MWAQTAAVQPPPVLPPSPMSVEDGGPQGTLGCDFLVAQPPVGFTAPHSLGQLAQGFPSKMKQVRGPHL